MKNIEAKRKCPKNKPPITKEMYTPLIGEFIMHAKNWVCHPSSPHSLYLSPPTMWIVPLPLLLPFRVPWVFNVVRYITVVVAPHQHQKVVIAMLLHVLMRDCSTKPLYSSVIVALCSTIPILSVFEQSLNLVLLGVHSWAMSYGILFPVCHYVYQSYQ